MTTAHATRKARPPVEAMAATRLLPYAVYQFQGYQVAPHHRLIAQHLERVERGEIRRLMICMPPRRGKSELTSKYFPAWYLGRNPDRSIIHASYSQDLADDFGRQVRNQIRDGAHRVIFPWCRLRPDSTAVRRFHTEQGGVYIAAGVNGPINGRGAHLFLIDDPVKGRADADSDDARAKLFSWYQSVTYNRLAPHGAIVLIMTRWHEDDLAGHLLRENPGEWTVLSLPEMAEPGDILGRAPGAVLWPERYPPELVDETRKAIGAREWEALYQQRPSPATGGMFKRDHWQRFTAAPDGLFTIMSVDATFKDAKESDFVAIQVHGADGPRRYLLDQTRARLSFSATLTAIRDVRAKWPETRAVIIEDKANGPAILDILGKEIPGLIPFTPQGSKLARAQAFQPMVEARNCYLPADVPWASEFVEEFASFPVGAHDDQVDAWSQALRYFETHALGIEELEHEARAERAVRW